MIRTWKKFTFSKKAPIIPVMIAVCKICLGVDPKNASYIPPIEAISYILRHITSSFIPATNPAIAPLNISLFPRSCLAAHCTVLNLF